jgi:hypothetical protein
MPIIAVSPAESAGFNESRHSSARNQRGTFSNGIGEDQPELSGDDLDD